MLPSIPEKESHHQTIGQTRTVYLNQRFRKALGDYAASIKLTDPQRPLFESQKGGAFSANSMCQLFFGHI